MKKIIVSIIFIFVYFICKAQTYPITQNLGSPSTLVKNPNYGGFSGGLVPYSFSDTTSANTALTYLKNYNGAIIYTTTIPALWFRMGDSSKWVQVLPSGSSTVGTNGWLVGGNTNVLADGSNNATFGTLQNNGIYFKTNATTRLFLDKSGLTFNQLASDTTLNKVLTYNTSTKAIGYGYWYGGGSGATPTWQQTLTAGSTLTGVNTIAGGGFDFTWNNAGTYSLTGSGNYPFKIIGANGGGIITGGFNSTFGGLWSNNVTPSTLNYALVSDGSSTILNTTGSIDLAVNSTSAMRIRSNGNVGIGAGTAPGDLLTLGTAGSVLGVISLAGSGSGKITIQPQAAAGTWTMTLPTTDGNSGEFLQTDGSGATSWAAPSGGSLTATYIGYGSAGNALTGDANLTYTAASSAVVIDSGYLSFTGHKAYGSTVAGSIFKHSDYGLTTRAIAGTTYDWLMFSTGGNTILANPTGTDNFLTSGRWGFGSLGLTPTAKVHIAAGSTSASTAPLKFVSGSLMTTAEVGAVEFLTDKAYLTITTGAARKELTLNDAALTSGRVPYVTTNGRLTDASNFTFDGSQLVATDIQSATGISNVATDAVFSFNDGGTTSLKISGSGSDDRIYYNSGTTHNFQTGTVTMGAYGAGTATFDASGNITSVSDMRLKDLQGMYEVGINRILQINPIVYKWNEKSKLERNHNYIGFSAQNVKDALGENAIGVNKEGYYSLQDRALLAAVVNGEKDLYKIIQEQQKQIDELKKDIKRLKK